MARRPDALPAGRRLPDEPAQIGVDEALQSILAAFLPLPAVEVPIGDALGFVLAADVVAAAHVPPFANSAMDGFALRAEDTRDASPARPVRLAVVAEASPGRVVSARVGPMTAIRIMTGSPLPQGADAVVRFEETDEADDSTARSTSRASVSVYRPVVTGAHVRPAGEDMRAGDIILQHGTRLRSAEIGVLAALNQATVAVYRRPIVALLATGDELVEPGQPLAPGQIPNSNAPMIAAMIKACGGDPLLLGVARDHEADLRAKLRVVSEVDLFITTGGVSVGDYDLVKHVLRDEGWIDFWQVRIKPGKPLAFGHLHGAPFLGLPGNPVAAAIAFEQFAAPAIRVMLGRRDIMRPTVRARLTTRVENSGNRRQFVRVRVELAGDGYVASPVEPRGAGVLSSLARANGLLVVPEEVSVAEPGDSFDVQMLDWES